MTKAPGSEIDVQPVAVFDAFFVRLSPETVSFFRRQGHSPEKSEECAQESFFRLFRVWSRKRDEEVLRPKYLITIALNLQRNIVRLSPKPIRPPENLRDSDAALERLEGSDDPLSDTLTREKRNIVREAVQSLAVQQSQCLHLRLQGHSLAEIGQLLNIATGTVASHLFQARQVLKRRLATYFDDLSSLDEGDPHG